MGIWKYLNYGSVATSSVDRQVPPRPQCTFWRYGTMHSSWVADVFDHSALPQMDTLALFCSTFPQFFFQFNMDVSHDVSPRPIFRVPPFSLDNPYDQKLPPGLASTIVSLAFINSCLYLGTHSNFLRIIWLRIVRFPILFLLCCYISFLAFWFLAWMMSFVTLSFSWLIAFMNLYTCSLDAKVCSNTQMVHG